MEKSNSQQHGHKEYKNLLKKEIEIFLIAFCFALTIIFIIIGLESPNAKLARMTDTKVPIEAIQRLYAK